MKTYRLNRLAVSTFADFLPSSLLPLYGRLGTALEAYDNRLKENTRRTVRNEQHTHPDSSPSCR